MTAWDYDEEVDAAVIHVAPRNAVLPGRPVTIDLLGVHVLLDVDSEGNLLTIELLGGGKQSLRYLGKYFKEVSSGNENNS